MSQTRRLPAAERRSALVDAALRVFAVGSYRGVTTAEIALEAGVSEPILYRHFESKRDLYLACLDEAWARLQATWETMDDDEGASAWLPFMGGHGATELRQQRVLLSNLWVQALTEAADDAVLRRHLRRHFREVHQYLSDAVRHGQSEGVLDARRDPEAEAWIFVALGLLGCVGRRLGGLIEDDLDRIVAARREWMMANVRGSCRQRSREAN